MKNSKSKKLRQFGAAILCAALVLGFVCSGMPTANAASYEGNIALSRKAAGEGMVLLKNEEQTLPLKKGADVALFGRGQITFVKGGTGSGDVPTAYVTNVLQGLQAKETAEKINLNDELAAIYSTWVEQNPGDTSKPSNPEMPLTEEQVAAAAQESETAVVVISRNSGENTDRKATKGDYYLTDAEVSMLDLVTTHFDKVAVVMNVGGMVDLSWVDNYPQITALLMAWLPGMEGGNAVADVLCGDVNPSGHLTDTIAYQYTDYPASQNFGTSGKVLYEEDIYIGYRYFETADPTYEKVQYPFGYGISYSDFEISDKQVTRDGDDLVFSATVTNLGPYPGKEVVQVYYQAPEGSLNKPAKELAGFAKTKELAANESQQLTVRFPIVSMASYDDEGATGHASAWVLEAGDYSIYAGTSIQDAGQNGVLYTHHENELRITEQLSRRLVPVTKFERLIDPVTGEKKEILIEGEEPTPPDDEAPVHTIDPEKEMTLIPATQFAEKSEGVGIEDIKDATGDLTQAVIGLGTTDTYPDPAEVSYKLNVPTVDALSVDIVFDYVNGRKASGQPVTLENAFEVYVNDTKQEVGRIDLPTTISGSNRWYNYQDSARYRITLNEMDNTLKLVCGSAGGPNLRSIKIYPVTGETTAMLSLANEAPEETPPESESTPGTLRLTDVAKGTATMEEFVNDLTNEELAYLCSSHLSDYSKTTGSTGVFGALPERGIPYMETGNGPAGLRERGNSTSFPMSTLLACSWDEALVEEVGEAMGKECLLNDVAIWLGPGMNIHRDPLCGRNFEYYSEDPLVSGKMAAAITRGVQSQGVAVSIKHFAANNQETDRNNMDATVSERALREIYLKGFEIAVKEAEPWTVMSSYNKINGTETSENHDLLTEVLRNEWGFEGFVMTDWGNNSTHYKEIAAGNDVKTKTKGIDPSGLLNSLNSGLIEREALVRSVTNVMNIALKLDVFTSSSPFKTQLKQYLSEAEGIDTEGYTISSALRLQDAIQEAKSILEATTATDEAYETACKTLRAAIDGLQLQPGKIKIEYTNSTKDPATLYKVYYYATGENGNSWASPRNYMQSNPTNATEGSDETYYSICFEGTGIELYTPDIKNMGQGAASLDDGDEVLLDFYGSQGTGSNAQSFVKLYSVSDLENGTHVLKVRRTAVPTGDIREDGTGRSSIGFAYALVYTPESDLIEYQQQLLNLVNEAQKIDRSGYTSSSLAVLDDALTQANTLLRDDDAAAEALIAMGSTLQDAIDGLVKKQSGGSTSGGSSTTTTTETREDGTKVTTVTKPDGSKTVTVEQPDGTKSETITTKDGDVTITVTDPEGEEVAKVEIPAAIPETETRFDDVPEGHWADEAIHNAAALKLVEGVGDNKYGTDAPMTRGALTTVLFRLSQGKGNANTAFEDVDSGAWYAESIGWASRHGVVKGISDTEFAPNATITREQLAVMLARYAKVIGLDTKADSAALDQFTDGENTGAWAVDGVAWCVENGILQGKGNDTLDPTANVTRAEVAMMLDRFIALIK